MSIGSYSVGAASIGGEGDEDSLLGVSYDVVIVSGDGVLEHVAAPGTIAADEAGEIGGTPHPGQIDGLPQPVRVTGA